ncbi:Glucan endo-1,3-beta-glucosidase, acidic isoform PR-Q' [Morus notabilis]|uniref:glucan endo-1,3-beta-D-glucosidase n=1 Tax=Morus notabilis TaxID=981085 RepID=W9REW9_9ROSA|nr:Glucan endo-1,3-beta-glucosidase, acidic isoform PR-Q' [Morus notabilis]
MTTQGQGESRSGSSLRGDGNSGGFNKLMAYLSTDSSAAANWIQTNLKRYASDVKFRYIAVGNKVKLESSDQAPSVLPAMENIYIEIASAALEDRTKVSTAIDTNLLSVFDPPSARTFSETTRNFIEQIKEAVMRDENGLEYRNLFDALMDALYSDPEKINGGDLEIVVAESGWPSDCGDGEVETIEKAGVYYRNLMD